MIRGILWHVAYAHAMQHLLELERVEKVDDDAALRPLGGEHAAQVVDRREVEVHERRRRDQAILRSVRVEFPPRRSRVAPRCMLSQRCISARSRHLLGDDLADLALLRVGPFVEVALDRSVKDPRGLAVRHLVIYQSTDDRDDHADVIGPNRAAL